MPPRVLISAYTKEVYPVYRYSTSNPFPRVTCLYPASFGTAHSGERRTLSYTNHKRTPASLLSYDNTSYSYGSKRSKTRGRARSESSR